MYGIVKQSGGHVSVYSEPGQGTGFKVYLPHVKAAAEPLPTKTPVSASLEGHETVLVVEDEEPLRALICRILREKGHAILEALSGQEALRVSDSHEGPIALLVTDVIMPGMSGIELLERISKEKLGGEPQCDMLSNQSEEQDREAALKAGAKGYIVKAELIPSEVVDEVLKLTKQK